MGTDATFDFCNTIEGRTDVLRERSGTTSMSSAQRVARQAAISSSSKKSPAQGRAFRSLALVLTVKRRKEAEAGDPAVNRRGVPMPIGELSY
jgi:hypothetical protein